MANENDGREKSLATRLRESGTEPIGAPPGARPDPRAGAIAAAAAAADNKSRSAPVPPIKSKPTTAVLKPGGIEHAGRGWGLPLLFGTLAAFATAAWLVPGLIPFEVPRLPDFQQASRDAAPKDAARPTAPPPPPAEDAATLRRRLTEAEERVAAITNEGRNDKRTIETLQARVSDQERQLAAARPRTEALEKELAELRTQTKDAPRPAADPQAPLARARIEALEKELGETRQQLKEARERPQTPAADPQAAGARARIESLERDLADTRRQLREAQSRQPSQPPGQPRQPEPQRPAPPPPQASAGDCAAIARRLATPVSLFFDRNRSALDPTNERDLDRLTSEIAPCNNLAVDVRGFADSQESALRGDRLARDRADATARAVERRGIASSRVRIAAAAAAEPRVTDASTDTRARSRRVEITVRPLN